MAQVAYMDPAKIHYLTIHCAATPRGRDVKAATISQWDIQKFGQVSYHHVVELDGNRVRTLRDDQRGAHVGGANTGNIGICYVGGVEKDGKTPADTRTDAQKASLLTLIRTYRGRYPGIIIRGHHDWPGVAKACPSFDVTAWLKEVGA
ncbi:N-acetylmuramoyl-L-alanine amidase [Rhizorhabdus histidinilytica]|uniref:N-acetylmuramoyl-L-alanine amidase n=1 Tax=Rhizorhabdus histidinilytica TaxID=439228 RepID=UPI00321F7A09